VKKSFRIFSILVALGLLAGALGIGSVLAGQVDRSRLDVLDSSYVPQAVVTVSDNNVEWAANDGEKISFVKADSVGIFYIQDDALETTKDGTRFWGSIGATTAAGDLFRVTDGSIKKGTASFADVIGGGTTTLTSITAAPYNTATPADTPLFGPPVVTIAGIGEAFVITTDADTGTFGLFASTAANATVTAAFKYHVRDSVAHTVSTGRAKVYSTNDTAGEFATVFEVGSVGSLETSTTGTISDDRKSVTLADVPITDRDGDREINGDDITVSVAGTALGTAASAVDGFSVDTVDFNSGVITFKATSTAVALPAGTITVSYQHATSNAKSRTFRGQVLLTSNPGARGTNNDGVWVQDGDTLTVEYLDSSNNVVDSTTVTVDALKPGIAGVEPAGGTITKLTTPTVRFEVTDAGSGVTGTLTADTIAITINGTAVGGNVSFAPITSGFGVTFFSSVSWKNTTAASGFAVTEGTEFEWVISATDAAGNVVTTTSKLTIDTAKPTLSSALTGTGWDAENTKETTGSSTSVKVVFSEDLDASTVNTDGSDFTVDGAAPTAAIVGTTSGNKTNVYLTVPALDPDAKPDVIVTGTVDDKAGNSLDTSSTAASKKLASDGLKPSATVGIDRSLAVAADKVKVTVETNEKLTTDGLQVSVHGPAAAAANGALSTTATTPLKNEGSITVGTGGTGQYGVSAKVTDLGQNSTDNLTSVTDEVPTTADIVVGTATTVITLDNGPIADADFNGTLDASDITSLTATLADSSSATSSAITAVDASARTITVTGLVDPAKTVKVSYKYVKTDVFEIDNSAPSVTFDPADATKIENTSPFIRIIFDDSEYPGDTHKTVTLTKAELTDPSGVTTDVKANFVTSDSKEYIWAASNLALGEYKLTVSGKDEALNEKKDASSTFTIKEREKFVIDLRPGWNLISLPGAAANPDINVVVDNPDVDIVLTYDPTVPGGWLTATRDAAGKLSGTLTTMSGTQGYWVHTTSFDDVKVDVPALSAGAQILPPAFSVAMGWNLVGVSKVNLGDANPDADVYFSSIKWSRAYSFDTANNTFASITPGVTTSGATVDVGRGYWVYVTEAGVLVP